MATGEIPFETAGQIEDKLLQYEELFKSRYTKDDPWYASTVQREQRWYHVPQIDPWPPHQFQPRRRQYKDMDINDERQDGYRNNGSRNRDRDFGSRERGRGHYDSWRRSPKPYYDRPPPHFRGHRGHSRGHSPSPPNTHYPRRSRSRSPLQQGRSPGRTGSSPRRPGSFPRRQEGDYSEDELQSNRPCPLPLERPGSFPWKQENNYNEGEVMSSGPLPPPPPHPHLREEEVAEEKSQSLVPLDIKEVTGLGEEEEEKAAPSQSDVLDILNTASFGVNEVNCGNLKQVQKETLHSAAKKPKAIKKKRPSSSSYLPDAFPPMSHDHTPPRPQVSVSHGRPQNVTEKPPRKKPKLSPISTETGTTAALKHSKGHEKSSKSKNHEKSPKVKGHGKGSKSKKLKSQQVSARSVLCGETQHAVSRVNPIPGYIARRQPCISSSSSASEGEVDVTTAIDTNISLSICLKKSLIGLDPGRLHAHAPLQPGEGGGAATALTVSIDRKRINQRSHHHDDTGVEKSAALAELSEPQPPPHGLTSDTDTYMVELDSTSNKMIFRVGSGDRGVSVEKKSKKRHKKKSKHAKRSKMKLNSGMEAGTELQDTSMGFQDTSRNYQDTSMGTSRNYQDTSQDTSMGFQDTDVDTGNVWIADTEPLKVKIKIPS